MTAALSAGQNSAVAKRVGTLNFSDAEAWQLRQMAWEGITYVEAARRLNRHHSTVLRQARNLSLDWRRPEVIPKPPKRPAGRRWTAEEDSRLAELVAAGASIDRAARDLDRHVSMVWRRAKLLGLR
jgi:transposase-like protein